MTSISEIEFRQQRVETPRVCDKGVVNLSDMRYLRRLRMKREKSVAVELNELRFGHLKREG